MKRSGAPAQLKASYGVRSRGRSGERPSRLSPFPITVRLRTNPRAHAKVVKHEQFPS